MNDPSTIGLAIAGWLTTTWLAYRWGLRSQRLERMELAASSARARKREFVAFLRGWRVEFDRLYLDMCGRDRKPSSFTDVLSTFVERAELVRADIAHGDRRRFDTLVAAVAKCDSSHFDNGKRYEQLLKMFDELTGFIESLDQ